MLNIIQHILPQEVQPDDDDFVYLNELNRKYVPNSALKKKESEDKLRGSMDPFALLGANNDNNMINDSKPSSSTMNSNIASNTVTNNGQTGQTNTLSTTAPTTPIKGTTLLSSPNEKSISMKKLQSNKMLDKSMSMKASLSKSSKNDKTKSISSKAMTKMGVPSLPKIGSKMGGLRS